jgi:predicted nuclease of predicted toxin-antitoxin system
MRTVVDAMFPQAVGLGVRRRSHDCFAVQEDHDLRLASDAELWDWAQGHRRALVTENAKDFLPLAAANAEGHFGLILTHNRSLPRHNPRFVGVIVSALDRLHLARPGDDPSGWVDWLQP